MCLSYIILKQRHIPKVLWFWKVKGSWGEQSGTPHRHLHSPWLLLAPPCSHIPRHWNLRIKPPQKSWAWYCQYFMTKKWKPWKPSRPHMASSLPGTAPTRAHDFWGRHRWRWHCKLPHPQWPGSRPWTLRRVLLRKARSSKSVYKTPSSKTA